MWTTGTTTEALGGGRLPVFSPLDSWGGQNDSTPISEASETENVAAPDCLRIESGRSQPGAKVSYLRERLLNWADQ
jgi:hypothetical protein